MAKKMRKPHQQLGVSRIKSNNGFPAAEASRLTHILAMNYHTTFLPHYHCFGSGHQPNSVGAIVGILLYAMLVLCPESTAQVTAPRVVFQDPSNPSSANKLTLTAQTGASSNYGIAFPFLNIAQSGTMPCFDKTGAQANGVWVDPSGEGEWLTFSNGVPTWQQHRVWSLAGDSLPAAGTGSNESFVGTTNNRAFMLATVSAQPMLFLTNNAEQVQLSSVGNLGIGLAGGGASQRLQVQGNLLLSNVGTASEVRLAEPSGSGTNYTGFRAGVQSSDILYTLPIALPGATYPITAASSGAMSWTSPSSLPSSDSAWKITGNTGIIDGTNFLGTTDCSSDNCRMNVRVNNLHVVVYEHFHSSPNIIAGLCSGNQGSINEANYIDYSNSSSGGRGNVIAGGGATSGNSLRTGGGGGNLMYGLSSGGPVHFSAISGGLAHTIVSRVADGVIMGGEGNIIEYVPIYLTSDSIGATVMGGLQNWVHSVVGGITGGGERHQVGGVSTLYYRCGILSGREMTAYYLDNSVIAGGYSHTMHGNAAARSSGIFVGGGIEHQSYVIANSGGVILGGGRNSFLGHSRDSLRAYMAIRGGHDNEIDFGAVTPTSAGSSVAFIGGGGENFVGYTPDYPTISGGFGNSLIEQTSYLAFRLNTYLPHYSAIPGGRALSIRQKGTFGFNGSTTVADVVIQPYTNANSIGLRIPIPTAAVFTDVNILLGNVDGTTRELVFAEPNTSKTYTGTHFTSFRAQAQTADVNYTLPAALGTGGSDYILRDLSGTGSLTWQSASSVASSGAWGLSGNAISSGGIGGQFIGTTSGNAEPFVLATNATERMRITSTGVIVTQHDTAVGIRMNATATSGTASITKRGLEILSTGQWDGASSTNIGLRSTVIDS